MTCYKIFTHMIFHVSFTNEKEEEKKNKKKKKKKKKKKRKKDQTSTTIDNYRNSITVMILVRLVDNKSKWHDETQKVNEKKMKIKNSESHEHYVE